MKFDRLNSETRIGGLDGSTILDFWSWAYSDILSNVNRGVLSEFLVASSLGLTNTPRLEWDAVDLRYGERTIEVKASGYCQSWPQSSLSQIQFGIGKTKPWDAATNVYGKEPERSADCYVFCLFTEKDQTAAKRSVLDASAWRFYVVATRQLDETYGEQKTLALSRLEKITDGVPYTNLRERIEQVLEETR